LEPHHHSFLRDGQLLPLPPKVFDLLALLLAHQGQTLEKERLINALWPDCFVEESSLTQLIFQLRKALGESAAKQQYIETIPRRGYRFVAEVKMVRQGESEMHLTSRTGTRILIEEKEKGAEDAPGRRDLNSGLPAAENDGAVVAAELDKKFETLTDQGSVSSATACVLAPPQATMRKKKRALAALSALVVISLAVIGASQYLNRQQAAHETKLPFQQINFRKLTTSGKAMLPAISSDGSYAAYVVEDAGRQSLWVMQVAATSRMQIIPPAELEYRGVTFSPDGQFVYYVVADRKQLTGRLLSVPVLGGAVREVITEVDSPISFSPSGERFAFVRGGLIEGETSLIVAQADGSGEQKLATRRRPDLYSTGGPAWSPDGKVIACGIGRVDLQHSYWQVAIVRVADGKENRLGSETWAGIGQVAWLNDGRGVVVQAWPHDPAVFANQLWSLAYPGGELQRVTRDLISYQGVSIAAHSDVLLTWRSDRVSRLWVAPEASASRARQIKSNLGDNFSEIFGLAWTPDGKIIYSSRGNGDADLWLMEADGSNQRQLAFDARRETWPVVSADGRSIVFVSQGPDGSHLWRMDADGSNRQQLTHGNGENFPSLSPDGRWVFFTSQELGWPVVARVSLDGGKPIPFTQHRSGRPVVSPDGKQVAYLFREEQTRRMMVALLPIEGGEPVKIFHEMPTPDGYLLRWTPDGRALAYIATREGVSNIWAQPIAGGPPRKLTDFKEDQIYQFAWSHDGKFLALDRGANLNDIILITNFK
jgi:Tol biopolymer transport system component/DNA-binding winged helix-turn-helix (wHTH) protein